MKNFRGQYVYAFILRVFDWKYFNRRTFFVAKRQCGRHAEKWMFLKGTNVRTAYEFGKCQNNCHKKDLCFRFLSECQILLSNLRFSTVAKHSAEIWKTYSI